MLSMRRRRSFRASTKSPNRARLIVEQLEERVLMNGGPAVRPPSGDVLTRLMNAETTLLGPRANVSMQTSLNDLQLFHILGSQLDSLGTLESIKAQIAGLPQVGPGQSSPPLPTASAGPDILLPPAGPTGLTVSSINMVEGASSGYVTVATFTGSALSTIAFLQYSSTISWGDGATTDGLVTGVNGSFVVMASHTYAEEGNFTVTVTVTDLANNTASANGTATVADAPLAAGNSLSYNGTAGIAFQAPVGYFSDADPAGIATDYSATINWGDNSTNTAGTIYRSGFSGINPNFSAVGTHQYLAAGTYTVSTTIQDSANDTCTTTATLTVPAQNGLGQAGMEPPPFNLVENTSSGTLSLAEFTNFNPNNPNYTATVGWGDGTSGPGTVTYVNGIPEVEVLGGHTYAEEGIYGIQVTLNDSAHGSTGTTIDTAIVADAALSAGTSTPVSATQQVSFSGPLDTFSDADATGVAADYSAVITWGDHTTSFGTVTGSGPFTVSGSHAYAQGNQTYNISIIVTDKGSSSVVLSDTAVVAGPPLPPNVVAALTTCNCSCSCAEHTNSLVADAGSGEGHNPGNDNGTVAPFRYADGVIKLPMTDLQSDGYGTPWGVTRLWSNNPGYISSDINGWGVVISQLPSLIQGNSGTTIAVVSDGSDARFFDLSGGNYTERFFLQDKFTYSNSPPAAGLGSNEYVLTDTSGAQIRFNDFTSTFPANEQGQFKSYTDPYGNVTSVFSHTTDGKVADIRRSVTVNSTTTIESFLYTYLPSTDPNASLLANVTLRRSVDNGNTWSLPIRQVQYSYYDGLMPYGNLGDLMYATVADGAGNALEGQYNRYYLPNETLTSYTHGLKYYLSTASLSRVVTAVGGNPALLALDSQVSLYADNYFQFDVQQRVTQEIAQGEGPGGLGTFNYTYTASGNAAGFNNWASKNIEVMPDGNQNIVYTNAYGEILLFVYHDATSGLNWMQYTQYDGQGRIALEAAPSAVASYNDSQANLAVVLNSATGLITKFDYYTTTTATETTAGGVAGYDQDVKIQQGSAGAPILQETWQYFAHSANGQTIAPVATDTVYRGTGGTLPETTSYTYTWVTGTAGLQSLAVSSPVISAAQNGPGTADVNTTFFDTFGQAIWNKDPDGFLTYIAYDNVTGAVTKSIDDVDTTKTADFQNKPAGWTTPSGGGLHLITQMVVDSLARNTEVIDPMGDLTYETYNDPVHETRVYRGWTGTATTGPTEVYRADRAGSYLETLTMSATPHVTGGAPDGTEAYSNLQTLSREYTNAAGQYTADDAYFNLSGVTYSTAPHIGTINVNYYETTTSYDNRGRQTAVQTPNGTIYQTVFDGLGRPVSSLVGTGAMVQTAAYVYDNNTLGGATQVGDGNLTQTIAMPGGSAVNRVSQFYYDWRERLVASKDGVQASENNTTHRPITYLTYDNLDEVTQVQQYDGDGVTITSTNGVPNAPAAGLLRAQSTASYDDQGRVYQTRTFEVNPVTGAVSTTALTSNVWYNHRGNVLETSAPGGLVSKMKYDGVGREIVSYTTDGASGTSWANASSVTSDRVLSQVEIAYDKNSNVIQVTDRQRNHDETQLGALGNPTTGPKARVSYSAAYYDAADRPTGAVDVGTNGGSTWTRPTTLPTASDTALVSSVTYNTAGWLATATDPRGIVSATLYDNLGRTTQTIEAYTNGVPTNNTNKTTNYTYDGNDNLLTLTAVQPAGGVETTKYLYGVTTATGSDVNSNDLLAGMQYPDPTTGLPSASQQETYTVNALGETKTFADRNGNVHTLSYDVLGRTTADAVTTLGTGVDGSVRRIETAYDTQGNPYLVTSFDAATAGNIVNQVQRVFNGFGQLTTEYQSHAGAVNTNTTPKVQYAYTEMAGGVNNSRLTSMTYPNGKVLTFNYATGVDNTISRLTSLSDTSGTLESYSYLGLATVVKRAHPQPGVDLTYIKQTGEANGDAGDQYTGLDRFGRIVDQRWIKTSTGVATDRFKYGYDRNSNALYRTNEVNHNFDELYHASGAGFGYDQLNQLSGFLRGVLSASGGSGTPLDTVASPTTTKGWNYDATGNWTGVTTNGTNQTRTANQQNEITAISGLTTPTYDKNGNTTTDEKGQTYVYDAWNRLVTVKSAGTTIASYKLDGMGRRIVETEGGNTRDLFFDNWNVLEERYNGAATADIQYVWSPVYVNALILRDRSTAHNGTLDERLYIQQDANWNVTALINTSGQVVERYDYDPYGGVTYLNATFGTLGSSAYAFNYLFQGERLDTVTGLYHMDNREYSPTLGRWMQNDPIGFAGGDNNIYGALSNNPGNSTDPPGLFPSTGFQILEIEIVKAQLQAEIKQSEGQLKRLGEISNTWRKCWNEYRGTFHEMLVGNPGQGPFFNALDKETAERKHLADLKMALLSVTDPIRARGLIQFERNHPSGSDGLAFSPVLEDPVNLVGIGLGGLKFVLGFVVRSGVRSGAKVATRNAGDIGKNILKWGEKQGPEGVKQTQCVTENLTKEEVKRMADKGLEKKWVQDQLRQYKKSALNPTKNLKNTQLAPRIELMEKILSMWPD